MEDKYSPSPLEKMKEERDRARQGLRHLHGLRLEGEPRSIDVEYWIASYEEINK